MTDTDATAETTTLSPPDAFSALGDGTRLSILHTLGKVEGPLTFSDLRERVGYETAGNFSYHLDKLEGPFIKKTDEGYSLRQAGRRVVQAVLSGAVTDAPEVDASEIDQACQYCGAPVTVSYHEEQVTVACTECSGVYGETAGSGDTQRLGLLSLPPAAVEGRTPWEVLQAAYTWGGLDLMSVSSGVCPRCGATLDTSVEVCSDHDATDGLCEACDSRFAVQLSTHCSNCIFTRSGAAVVGLIATTEFLAFLTTHGINPLTPSSQSEWGAAVGEYEENVLSTEPFKGQFTFTIDGDHLTLTVNENLSVIDASGVPSCDSR